MKISVKQTLPIVILVTIVFSSSCGSEEAEKNEKETTSSKYANDLSKIKEVFCHCIETGVEVKECESEANDLISEAKDRLELSDDEWRQMTVDAGAAMRECVE